jgi:hypothetical protein
VVERYGADPEVVTYHLVLAAYKHTNTGAGNRARARRLGQPTYPSGVGLPLATWALERLDRA